jgi:hypothetical protein
MRPTNVNTYLRAIIERHSVALDQGAIISVTEGRTRVRRLPISGADI